MFIRYTHSSGSNNNNNNNGRSLLGRCECQGGLGGEYDGTGQLIQCSPPPPPQLQAVLQGLEATLPTPGMRTILKAEVVGSSNLIVD